MDEERRDLFDIVMEAYDGAEVCELVGIFLTEKLAKSVIKVILDYIGMMVYQFLKIKVVVN